MEKRKQKPKRKRITKPVKKPIISVQPKKEQVFEREKREFKPR